MKLTRKQLIDAIIRLNAPAKFDEYTLQHLSTLDYDALVRWLIPAIKNQQTKDAEEEALINATY
tara:strand:+ start:120 stop:311 length:192 start_codon:yes stop_codon:yes gene_type:complete